MLESSAYAGRKEYRRLVEAFERVFGATIFFGADTLSGKAKVISAPASTSFVRFSTHQQSFLCRLGVEALPWRLV
jgi:hypothetical protein